MTPNPHQTWEPLLTKIPQKASNERIKQLEKRKRFEIQLLDWLRNEHREIHAGIEGLHIGKETNRQIFKHIVESSESIFETKAKNRLLQDMLIFGSKHLKWTVDGMWSLFSLPRNVPLLNKKDFRQIACLRALQLQLTNSLSQIDRLSQKARSGQIIYASIVHGCLFPSWKIRALLISSPDQWVVEPFGTWCDLIDPTPKKTPPPEPRKWRWFPDPISEFLILRWWKDFGYIPIHSEESPFAALKSFFTEMDVDRSLWPASIPKLSQWASCAAALTLPPYYREFCLDRPYCTPLPAETWLRIYTGKRVYRPNSMLPLPENHARKSDLPKPTSNNPVPLSKQMALIRDIRISLSRSKSTRPEAIAAIEKLLANAAQENQGQMPLLIAQFILSLLKHGGTQKKVLAKSTIKRYLGAIAAPMIKASADISDLYALSENEWIDCLQEAIDDSKDQMGANRLADFASFIHQHPDLPQIDVTELEGITAENRVNANLITPNEFEVALNSIQASGRLLKIARLIASLAFYCGLRRNEALHLLVKDVAGRSSPELLVRPNKHASTKNRLSRRIPLKPLLPPKIFDEFMQWYDMRVSEQGKIDHSLLFCHGHAPHQPLKASDVIEPIVEAVRYAAGDQTLVFHSLRHSFANWLLLRLMAPEIPGITNKDLHAFSHSMFSVKGCKKLRQAFYPFHFKSAQTTVRDILPQVSELMGHKSPDVTLKSYLHLLDWCTRNCLAQNQPPLPESTLKTMADCNEKYWFQLKREKLKGLKPAEQIEFLLRRLRKKHLKARTNPASAHVMKGRKRTKLTTHNILQPKDLPTILLSLFEKKIPVEDVAGKRGVAREEIERIKLNAESLYRIRTRGGNPRLPLIPAPIKLDDDRKDMDTMLLNAEKIPANSKLARRALRAFLLADPSHGMEVIHGNVDDAIAFRDFLIMLGIARSRLIARYYPDSRASDTEVEQGLVNWSKLLDISKSRIRVMPPSQRRKSLDENSKLGRISIGVSSQKKSNPSQRSQGVRCALHLLAVWYADRLLS